MDKEPQNLIYPRRHNRNFISVSVLPGHSSWNEPQRYSQ